MPLGIGHISTRWVGEKGKEELVSEMKELKYRQELEELKAQICQLADECKKALLQATVTSCNQPQLLKAINLCNKYLPTQKDPEKKVQNEPLKSLWDTTNSTAVDPTSILGQDLVGIITEKNKQPPDVSYYQEYI